MSGAPSVCMRRLRRELLAIKREHDESLRVAVEQESMLGWHFVINGVPDSPFGDGEYWGRINFPETFPIHPPSIFFFTPNGRFETGKRLCLHGVSDYHRESWDPKTTVKGLLLSVRHAMCEEGIGIGSISESTEKRQSLAKKSKEFNLRDARYRQLFQSDSVIESVEGIGSPEGHERNKGGAVPTGADKAASGLPAASEAVNDDMKHKVDEIRVSDGNCKSDSNADDHKGNSSSSGRDLERGSEIDGNLTTVTKQTFDIADYHIIEKLNHAIRMPMMYGKVQSIIAENPLAVHAIQMDGKTPAVKAALRNNWAAFFYIIERGGCFKHHGPEPYFNGHHVSTLLQCEKELVCLINLRGIYNDVSDYNKNRKDLIQQICRILHITNLEEIIGLPTPAPNAVIRSKFILEELNHPLCFTYGKIQRLRILIDIFLTDHDEIGKFVYSNGIISLEVIAQDLERSIKDIKAETTNLDDLDECLIVTESCVANGLYLLSRIALFICLKATADKRQGSAHLRDICVEHGICQLLNNILSLRHVMDTVFEQSWTPAPAYKTVAFAFQSLTELSFDPEIAKKSQPVAKDLICSLETRYIKDRGCAEMISWWSLNLISAGVFSHGGTEWAVKLAAKILTVHTDILRAKDLLDATNRQRITAYRAACDGTTSLLLNCIDQTPVEIHRPDPTSGQIPLTAAASTGNQSVCDCLIVLIERGSALKYHALPPNRGRHHVDKFLQHEKIIQMLAQLAEVGYNQLADKQKLRTCPHGQLLKEYHTPVGEDEGYKCDMCDESIPPATVTHGCRCDDCDGGYDECCDCYDLFVADLDTRLKKRDELIDTLRAAWPPPPLAKGQLTKLLKSGVVKNGNDKGHVDEEERCFMCAESFSDIEPCDLVCLKNDCQHWHHKPCLEQWLVGNRGSCPTCDVALTAAWPERPVPPSSPMSTTEVAVQELDNGLRNLDAESAALGARILADQALTTERRARQILGSDAMVLLAQICVVHKHAPRVLYNVGLALLEMAISLKLYFTRAGIKRVLPLASALLDACLDTENLRSASNDQFWPLLAGLTCQATAELVLGEYFVEDNAYNDIMNYGIISKVLQVSATAAYNGQQELMRMVWIILNRFVCVGGRLADTCEQHCAALLYWKLIERRLPESWLEPLATAAGPVLSKWSDTTSNAQEVPLNFEVVDALLEHNQFDALDQLRLIRGPLQNRENERGSDDHADHLDDSDFPSEFEPDSETEPDVAEID